MSSNSEALSEFFRDFGAGITVIIVGTVTTAGGLSRCEGLSSRPICGLQMGRVADSASRVKEGLGLTAADAAKSLDVPQAI
jgi:hypothetical protein